MKLLVLASALFFAALQAVTITDCPCAALCSHKNDCKESREDSDQKDCCRESEGASGHPVPCFHLEPQTELDGFHVETAPALLFAVDLAAEPTIVVPRREAAPTSPSGLSPPKGDPPLYLQHSRLQI